jgi:hypothetical protein
MCYDASEASQLIYMQQVSYNAYTYDFKVINKWSWLGYRT